MGADYTNNEPNAKSKQEFLANTSRLFRGVKWFLLLPFALFIFPLPHAR
jgi:hypothetical protein